MIIEHQFAGHEYTILEWPSKWPELQRASLGTFVSEDYLREKFWYFQPGDVIFDIGAGFGNYTLPALVQGARVYAFEPDLNMLKGLIGNVELNTSVSEQCMIVACGLGGSKSKMSYTPGYSQEQTSIQLETLDGFVDSRNIDRIDMIKLDTEGLEMDIMSGGIKSIEQFKPKMLIELHKFLDSQIEAKVRGFLNQFGYSFELVPYDTMVDHIFAKVQ